MILKLTYQDQCWRVEAECNVSWEQVDLEATEELCCPWAWAYPGCPRLTRGQSRLPIHHSAVAEVPLLSCELQEHASEELQKRDWEFIIVQLFPKTVLRDHLSGQVTFTGRCCKYGRALSFTLCIFCTIIISCSLTSKERIYCVSLTVFHSKSYLLRLIQPWWLSGIMNSKFK